MEGGTAWNVKSTEGCSNAAASVTKGRAKAGDSGDARAEQELARQGSKRKTVPAGFQAYLVVEEVGNWA